MIVCDNGHEFTGRALDTWAYARGVPIHFIRPGQPIENAYAESFIGRMRARSVGDDIAVPCDYCHSMSSYACIHL
jgi:transposase InsO family protein